MDSAQEIARDLVFLKIEPKNRATSFEACDANAVSVQLEVAVAILAGVQHAIEVQIFAVEIDDVLEDARIVHHDIVSSLEADAVTSVEGNGVTADIIYPSA